MQIGHWLHKSWVGLKLRCPNCEQGKTFTGLFRMNRVCLVCGVRFERQSGESVGGMYFNLGFAELTSIGGFFITDALLHPPLAISLGFWVTYNILFCALFYRHARSLWIAVSYLTGGVQTDEVYAEQEAKRAPNTVRRPYQ